MKRLYSLDALRGIGALAVIFWHWQHFFAVTGTWQSVWQREWQPFWSLFRPFYLEGWAAVDLFFALSGFVFFWLYREAIREGKVKAGSFALLRFSRLYPLHALTLFIVLGLQAAFHGSTGNYFIFPAGDWDRFFANLFMVQQWAPPSTDQTFNGPAWTVSIEASLYVLFFILCRFGLNGPKTAAVVALAGVPLFHWNWFISRGLMGFFLGGLAYFAVEAVRRRPNARRWSIGIGIGTILLWVYVFIEIAYGPLHALLGQISDNLPDDWDYYSENSDDIFHLLFIFGVVPVTIAALALSEAVLGIADTFYKRVSYLGDISYSTYMLHFPLQICCALIALHTGLTGMFFMHGWFMISFYAVLIALGSVSYFYYEKPAQSLIRRLTLPKRTG